MTQIYQKETEENRKSFLVHGLMAIDSITKDSISKSA